MYNKEAKMAKTALSAGKKVFLVNGKEDSVRKIWRFTQGHCPR